MDGSPPGSSVHGIFQARILEWIAIPFSRGSSQSRDWMQVSWIAGRFFTVWATREAQEEGYKHWPWPISPQVTGRDSWGQAGGPSWLACPVSPSLMPPPGFPVSIPILWGGGCVCQGLWVLFRYPPFGARHSEGCVHFPSSQKTTGRV